MERQQPFGGYYSRALPAEDAELTRVGPGTPAGEYLRRFWQPVFHTEALKDLPVAIRILGEDLIIFKDGDGRIGLLNRHCSHRGASLEYGIIEAKGIRCCYHGWLFSVDGTILDTPGESADSRLKHDFCQGAYPTREFGGLVFAYMGPPDKIPPFPLYDTLDVPGLRLGRGELRGLVNIKPCNWLQIIDNVCDPVHEVFLHARASGYQFFDENGRPAVELGDMPEADYVETPIGLANIVTRRVGDTVWVRNVEYICPNIAQISRTPPFPIGFKPGQDALWLLPRVTRWRVPVDDTNTLEYALIRLAPGQANPYIENPEPVLRSNYGGRSYEEMQRTPGDYEAQISQRSIAIHALEHRGGTDRGVTMLRRMLRREIQAVQRGEDPKGVLRQNGPIPTYGFDAVFPAPPANSEAADRAQLRTIMRQALDRVLERPLVASGEHRI